MRYKKIFLLGALLSILIVIVGCSGSNSNSQQYNLDVGVSPNGTGTISINPLKSSYDEGEEVTLTVSNAVAGYEFDHWQGSGYDTTGDPLVITMVSDVTLTAVFVANDITTPSWITEPNITTAADTSSVGISAEVNKSGKIYYQVLNDGTTAPTASEVKSAGNSIEIEADTETEITITSLSAGSDYDIYFTAEDEAGNLASVYYVDVSTIIENSDPLNPNLTVNVLAGNTTVENGDLNLSYNLEMGKYEITNAEYVQFLNDEAISGQLNGDGNWVYEGKEILALSSNYIQIDYDGSSFSVKDWTDNNGTTIDASNYPVNDVTWYGAVAYTNWLSQQEGVTPAYDLATWSLKDSPEHLEGYRLPTKLEWEYAARGGANGAPTAYAGAADRDDSEADDPNDPSTLELDDVAWYIANSNQDGNTSLYEGASWDPGPGWKGTMPVGTKLPNELGIYDFTGNVAEWTTTNLSDSTDFNEFQIVGGHFTSSIDSTYDDTYYTVDTSDGSTVKYSEDFSSYWNGFRIARTKE